MHNYFLYNAGCQLLTLIRAANTISKFFLLSSKHYCRSMVHPGGFEPPTARFVAEYSIQLSYGCISNGGEGGIRTLDAAFDRILP